MQTMRTPQAALIAVLAAAVVAIGASAPEKAKETPSKGMTKAAAPACLRCGTTCDLEPICVCEPGTTKKPRVEYDVECEPFCVAGCSSSPWLFGRHRAAGCTSCVEEPCNCSGSVRTKKLLRKAVVEEEACVVARSVAYLCGRCSGRDAAGCCDAVRPECRPSWWSKLKAWWP